MLAGQHCTRVHVWHTMCTPRGWALFRAVQDPHTDGVQASWGVFQQFKHVHITCTQAPGTRYNPQPRSSAASTALVEEIANTIPRPMPLSALQ
jgi:hypothetical protein